MVETLIIGDLHFDNKPMGLLEAQKNAVLDIYDEWYGIENVIFLGDLMMHRKPYPRVLLALKEVMDYISANSNVFILRGNHDSENKADDGVTALSLLESKNVKVITQSWVHKYNKWAFIPHYEDEEKIKKVLSEIPEDYYIFGHFGYYGSLNSAGDADFSLSISDFNNPAVLGHIHRYSKGETVSLLGTPYTTNFSEHKKENFYGVLENSNLVIYPVHYGPRHLVIDHDLVEENLEWINDPDYFTLLRINMSTLAEDQETISDLTEKLNVGYLELKYKPLLEDSDEYEIDNSINPITEINDFLIEDYINSSNTTINKDILFAGLNLIYENQQNRDK
jgi:predicted phosphodiesterase